MARGRVAFRLKENGRRGLVAESGADRDALAADGAAAAQHGGARLGLHARTETMGFHALAAIGLKGTLGHENILLFPDENLRLDGKYLV
jgi:hypothetical protein